MHTRLRLTLQAGGRAIGRQGNAGMNRHTSKIGEAAQEPHVSHLSMRCCVHVRAVACHAGLWRDVSVGSRPHIDPANCDGCRQAGGEWNDRCARRCANCLLFFASMLQANCKQRSSAVDPSHRQHQQHQQHSLPTPRKRKGKRMARMPLRQAKGQRGWWLVSWQLVWHSSGYTALLPSMPSPPASPPHHNRAATAGTQGSAATRPGPRLPHICASGSWKGFLPARSASLVQYSSGSSSRRMPPPLLSDLSASSKQ